MNLNTFARHGVFEDKVVPLDLNPRDSVMTNAVKLDA